MLVVAQSSTPGHNPLPGTVEEINRIGKYIPDGAVVLKDGEATISAVLSALKDHNWLHLACHGLQDPTDPTNSAFALYDGNLKISQLMKVSAQSAALAVLSACQTATGDERLPEESVHLSAVMLTIGFKQTYVALRECLRLKQTFLYLIFYFLM